MRRFYRFYPGRLGTALLLLRLISGIAFLLHGWPKVQNPAAFASAMQLPLWLGSIGAWVEVIGGALLLLGLLTPVAALLITLQMLATFPLYHLPKRTPFINPGGANFELALLYLVIGIVYLLTGPGIFSVDACLFGRERREAREQSYARSRRVA